MRSLRALRVIAALLLLGTVVAALITIPQMSRNRRWIDDTNRAMMRYALAQHALQVNLLTARAGLLRNYDPLNADIASTRDSLALLQGVHSSASVQDVVQSMRVANARQEALVERFKSSNALLQNSLTRFTANGSQESGTYNYLSAQILKLTLDTSPATVRDAQAALRRMTAMPEGTSGAQMISHARLLVRILPEIDATLQAIRAIGMETRIEQLRVALNEEAEARTALEQTRLIALRILTLLFLASVIAILMLQRLHNRELRAQAASERLSATIAIPLIDTVHQNFLARAQDAVEHLARHNGARRMQLLIPDFPNAPCFVSPPSEPDDPWLERLAAASDADEAWDGDLVVVPDMRGQTGALGRGMRDAGVKALVMLRTSDPFRVLIGFEPERLGQVLRPDHLAGLASALVAIAHGARREVLQIERDRLERKLAQARRMEAIGAMASGVAHNFNNILGAIRGFAEMGQERTRNGSSSRRNFDEIQAAVERARGLVDDILGFAKQGRTTKRVVNLFDILEQTVRLLGASLRYEAQFTLAGENTHCAVLGAEADLQQVFLNICNNAAQASRGRAVRIAVRRQPLAEERHFSHSALLPGKYVVVEISDSGSGIDLSIRRRLFEPFFTTKPGGTGLGLSTAWEIIQGHGGTIDVGEAPAGGARFSVWLPEVEAGSGTSVTGDGARVLLLGDSGQLSSDEEMLAELGYEPLAFPLEVELGRLRAAVADVDAVLVASWRTEAITFIVERLRTVLDHQPLLVAAPTASPWAIANMFTVLAYPLQPDELAARLAELETAAKHRSREEA
jgi:signal transduction histidine kinase